MATNTGVKFYKFSNSTTSASKIATAKAAEGAIIYITDVNELWIGGATPKLALKGANDVSYSNSVLTVTHYSNDGGTLVPTTQTLDFSDVASAQATLKVFESVYGLMGTTESGSTQTLDYSGTTYLADLGTTGHPDKNLVNADKALDAAIDGIADTIAAMDAIADADTASGTGYATITTTTPTADFKVLNSITEVDGKLTEGEAYQLKKVAATAESEDLLKSTTSTATYDTTSTEISQSWITVVEGNELEDGDDVDEDLNKLDNKIAGLADEVINNERVVNEAVNAMADSIGLENDLSLDLSSNELHIIKDDESVKEALMDLDAAVSVAGKVDDVKINNTSIVSNKIADIAVDGTYNASTNKIASVSTVTNAINALDVSTDKGAASISGSTITINAVQQEDGLIKDGGSTTINLDGTYDASTNKIATESTVSDAIEALDATNIQGVDYTAADASNGVKLTFKGVSETDGVIAQGTGTTELQFAKVATTGAAADVSIADAGNHTSETNVEGALQEIYGRVETLEGSFDVIKSVDAATTPAGVTWIDDNQQTVTGTLPASADTFHKVYLVPVDSTGTNKYAEYITTKDTSGQTTTYAWERLGTIDVDLTGYVKNITLNGKQYAVDNNSVNITLTDVITGVTGETAISGGDTNYVKVAANTVKDTTNGTNVTTLSTTVQLEEVADGLTKDNSPSYTTGHYIIQNGKLVDASTASTGDTYTISANDGLTKASDVKAYVDSKVGTAIQSVDGSTTEKDKSVTQSDYATVKVTATTDANNNVTLDSAVGLTIQAVSTSDPSSAKGLAEASDVKSYVDGVVEGLDVTEYAQATIDTTTSQTDTTITIKGIKEEDGEISGTTTNSDVDIEVNGTYNASTNKIATQSTVTNAIAGLDGSATIASVSNNVVTIKTGVTETDGIISNTTGTTDIVLEEVAVTGAASDVSYNNTTSGMTATTVQAAIDELKSGLCWEEYE